MQAQRLQAGGLRFESFELDLEGGELRRQGKPLPLQGKPLQLLTLLLTRPGRPVSREEIRERLWGTDTHVEFNDSLNHTVRRLREALEDSAENPRFIQTLPRRGYRFAAAVEGVYPAEGPVVPVESLPLWTRWTPRLLMALLAVAAVGFTVWPAHEPAKLEEAERAYRTGMDLLRRRNLVSARGAAEELRRAIALRPEFARAWAGLAEAAALFLNPHDRRATLELAQRSVQLDGRCGECHAVLGFVLFSRYWKWTEAEQHLRRAIELSPEDAQTRYWRAQLQAVLGRPTECVKLLDQALMHTPHGFNLLVMKGGCLYLARDYKAAVEVSDQALALNLPGGWSWRSRALFLLGSEQEAVRSMIYDMTAYLVRPPDWAIERADKFDQRYRQAGLDSVLGDLLDETSDPSVAPIQSHNRAVWQMLLGKHNSALSELELGTASDSPPFSLIYLGVDPLFDPVRQQPRFQNILRKMGLGS